MSSIKTKIVITPTQWDRVVGSLNAIRLPGVPNFAAITTAATATPLTKMVGVRVVVKSPVAGVETHEHLLFMPTSFIFYFKWFGLYTPPKTGGMSIADMGRWRTMDLSIYTNAAHSAGGQQTDLGGDILRAAFDMMAAGNTRGKEMRATRLCNMAMEDLDWRPSSVSAPAPLMFIRAPHTKGN